MKSLAALQEGMAALAAGQDLPVNIGTNIGRCEQVLQSVNLVAYKQEKRDAGDFDTSQELICKLYDFTAGDFTENKFKLSEAKNLPSFTGTEDNPEAHFESFIHAIGSHGKASKLSSKGLASLILNKIPGAAARILTSSLILRNLKEEDLDTLSLMSVCESLFIASCSVKQSKLQLTQLKPLSENSTAFTELQANLVRLVTLSVRDIQDKSERQIIFRCRTQDYFNNLIPPRPRRMLTEHNAVRLRSGLENLSLAASVIFLN